jgi:hypothetical protein
MPFPDNTFDFVYAQEATVHAAELRDVYVEMCRVLKPGGVMSVGEWCMTSNFDPKNPQHLDVRRRIERGDGIANMKTVKEAIAEFEFVDLDVLHMEDHALKGLQSRPWWAPLDGDTSKFSDPSDWMMVFCLKPAVWKAWKAWVWFKIKVGLYSKVEGDSTLEAINTQAQAVYGLRDGGKDGKSSDTVVSRRVISMLTILQVCSRPCSRCMEGSLRTGFILNLKRPKRLQREWQQQQRRLQHQRLKALEVLAPKSLELTLSPVLT